ncbi:MAG: sulfotransferase [Patescibacteria group bacterium]|jgi:hypothetical protein
MNRRIITQPVFIFGCSNSGQSILARTLTDHPAFCGLPLMRRPDNHGQLHHLETQDLRRYRKGKGWPKELTHRFGKETARLWAISKFRGLLMVTEADYTPSLARRTKTVLRRFVKKGKRLVLTGPANLLRARLFATIFSDAKFVAVVRYACAVAEGIIRKRLHDPQRPWISGMQTTIQQAAEQWENANVLLLLLQQFLGDRLLIVHYEDLVTKPKATLSQVLAFLGESSKGFRAPRFKRKLNQRQAGRLTADEREVVERTCWPMMDHFDYARPKPHVWQPKRRKQRRYSKPRQ